MNVEEFDSESLWYLRKRPGQTVRNMAMRDLRESRNLLF